MKVSIASIWLGIWAQATEPLGLLMIFRPSRPARTTAAAAANFVMELVMIVLLIARKGDRLFVGQRLVDLGVNTPVEIFAGLQMQVSDALVDSILWFHSICLTVEQGSQFLYGVPVPPLHGIDGDALGFGNRGEPHSAVRPQEQDFALLVGQLQQPDVEPAKLFGKDGRLLRRWLTTGRLRHIVQIGPLSTPAGLVDIPAPGWRRTSPGSP